MLYIISTPIGNLDDITIRALKTLEVVDVLLCEDTRVTGKLLGGLGIKNRPQLVSFYDEVEEQKIPKVIDWLKSGMNVGLVSDAGTPLLSDPGWKLIKRCQTLGIHYTALPGASSVINALVLSGLPMGRFSFLGFLPKKKGERIRILENYRNVEGAKVVLESPLRLGKLVEDIRSLGYREWRVLREMTKKFEEVTESAETGKGEIVVVFI